MLEKERTDEELIALFRQGEQSACDNLLMRYKNTVLSVARGFFLVGGDTEDLVQEGMCGLYSAITSFKGDSGFAPYAYACIKNRILDAVKRYSVRGATLSLHAFAEEIDEGADKSLSPEDALLNSEDRQEFLSSMKEVLSPLEYKAMRMYIDGATMAEVVSSLGITYKQADNALARAKSKLKKMIDKDNRN